MSSKTNTVEFNFALGTGGSLIAPATANTIGSLFTTGGNIGIGTTAPTGKLDIAGRVVATDINVTNLTIGNLTVGLNSQYSGSFNASNNVSAAADVTGFLVPAGITSFESSLTVTLVSGTTAYENFAISGVKTASSWALFISQKGTSTGVQFSMNSSGQLQYTSTNVAGFVSSTFRFSVSQISGTGSFTPSNPVTSGNYLFDSIIINNTTNAVSGTSLGGLSVLGGATIAKDLVVSGKITQAYYGSTIFNGQCVYFNSYNGSTVGSLNNGTVGYAAYSTSGNYGNTVFTRNKAAYSPVVNGIYSISWTQFSVLGEMFISKNAGNNNDYTNMGVNPSVSNLGQLSFVTSPSSAAVTLNCVWTGYLTTSDYISLGVYSYTAGLTAPSIRSAVTFTLIQQTP